LSLITEELESMVQVGDLDQIRSKRKAIIALFPYVIQQERVGDCKMADTFLGVARVPYTRTFMAQPIATLLDGAGPDLPNRLVTLISPYALWGLGSKANTVIRWAEAVLAVPYTEEVGVSVVDTLLQIASLDFLRPYIPVNVWAWLKQQPSLPPICDGRSAGTVDGVVRMVRELGDIEILKSYFLLIWSEWDSIHLDGFAEMRISIREDLGGIGMGHHREVLVERLDHVLGQLDRGLGHFTQHNPRLGESRIPLLREQYGELKGILLEVDRVALEILTRTSLRSTNSFNSLTRPQSPTRRSFVRSLSHVRSRAS